MDPPGKNRDVEETLLQVAHDPDCGDVVRLGTCVNLTGRKCWLEGVGGSKLCLWLRRVLSSFLPSEMEREISSQNKKALTVWGFSQPKFLFV